MSCPAGPNFFVVGAPKAGTTTLYRHLSRHPSIFVSPIKEPNHFCSDLHGHAGSSVLNDRLPLDIRAYLDADQRRPVQVAWVESRHDYLRLFEGAGAYPVRGECSTSYLHSTTAACNIASFDPGAKIIALLRDPVDRAYSHYLMDRRIGITTRSFREEIEQELAATDLSWSTSRLYVSLGRYAEQLGRYYGEFPRDQILVVFTDQLHESPEDVLARVAGFLGVEPLPAAGAGERANPAALPRFQRLNRLLHRTQVKRWLRAVLPTGFKQGLKRWYFRGSDEAGPDAGDRDRILEELRPDIERLAAMLDRDLSGWLAPRGVTAAAGERV